MTRRLSFCLLFSALAGQAHAWNALGHKVVCEIAWQQIDQPTRDNIVATLRRHSRFDDDFAKAMPAENVDR
ncbi:MAG: hypothetical protein IH898_11085 [Planctomycetes bacterium]|nr:hypothetical protein [Planctomycetota bacterium]